MENDKLPAPRQYRGVVVSSTFTDLEEHRTALIKAIKGQDLNDIAMENDSAKADVDVIDSSLQDGTRRIGVHWSHQPKIWADSTVPETQSSEAFHNRTRIQ